MHECFRLSIAKRGPIAKRGLRRRSPGARRDCNELFRRNYYSAVNGALLSNYRSMLLRYWSFSSHAQRASDMTERARFNIYHNIHEYIYICIQMSIYVSTYRYAYGTVDVPIHPTYLYIRYIPTYIYTHKHTYRFFIHIHTHCSAYASD